MELVGLYLYAFLLGSFPTTLVVGRALRGLDIRRYGSGNVGVTNLSHHVGRKWLAPVILFEVVVKGSSAILLGRYLLGLEYPSWPLALAGILAVAGNNWSIVLKLRGGRGIAVAGGTLLALTPLAFFGFVAVFLPGWLLTRSSGVWTLISLAFLPVWPLALGQPTVIVGYCALLATLIVLKRLLSNWEPLPKGIPRRQVFFNRLLFDRDVADRAEWIRRVPSGPQEVGLKRE
jgi:glycerol-3-phosphate acyltransferase PlsY